MLKKRILGLLGLLLLLLFIAVLWANRVITNHARGRLFDDPQAIPYNRVGILLGTSKYLTQGGLNPYYSYRIEAAVRLMKAEKIKYLVISGDNRVKNYNEPRTMRTDLIREGIDSTRLYMDYAGLRTFDSMVRIREIFGQDSVTVISQAFHNERALYIADREGITAIGFNATEVAGTRGLKTALREKLARVKLFLDGWFGKRPRYLAEKIPIPG